MARSSARRKFSPAAVMTDCVPPLMVSTPRTGAIATQQWWERV